MTEPTEQTMGGPLGRLAGKAEVAAARLERAARSAEARADAVDPEGRGR